MHAGVASGRIVRVSALFDWLTDPDEPRHAADELGDYVYRYMGADGLLLTVKSQTLRMNAWSQMNDPREAREWVASHSMRAVGSYTQEELNKRLDAVMRRSARLMSLTDDREPVDGAAKPNLFHRGWARAAQWAHYANGHRGVCLVLSVEGLAMSTRLVPAVDRRYTTWGHVRYIDQPIDIGISGDFDSDAAVDAAIEAKLDQRFAISNLHMVKNHDWSYEQEVRLLTVDLGADDADLDTPLYLPLGGSLAGVIFGDAHPAPDLIADGIRSLMGARAPEMCQCGWLGGAPQLRPIP